MKRQRRQWMAHCRQRPERSCSDMKRVKRRIFSGVVCEQVVFSVPDRIRDLSDAAPQPRFKTEEERAAHRLGISRRQHVRIVNRNFGPSSRYSTLTMDDEHEVHTFQEARRVRDNFYARLKYRFPDAKILIYMGRGKSTHRIHLHMLSDGIPEDAIRERWTAGSVLRIDPLREHNYHNGVDRGQDYTGLANYLFDHWTPEQGGHRWKGSRKTLERPDYEEPTVVKRDYTVDKPPRPPKGYVLVETTATRYGYLYYKYVLKPQPRKRARKSRE